MRDGARVNEVEIHAQMTQTHEQLGALRDALRTASKAMMDEKQRQHTIRALASVELALLEIAAALFPGGASS